MARTQPRLPVLSARRDPATFMAFDGPVADGVDVCIRPWVERRRLLEDLYELVSQHRRLAGQHRLPRRPRTANRHPPAWGLGAVVVKRWVTSRYWPGRCTPNWCKVKHRSYGGPRAVSCAERRRRRQDQWLSLSGAAAPGRHPGLRAPSRFSLLLARVDIATAPARLESQAPA